MAQIDNFLNFILTPDDQIIERDEWHIMIRRFDMVMQVDFVTNIYSETITVEVFDYYDYLNENEHYLSKIKEEYFLECWREANHMNDTFDKEKLERQDALSHLILGTEHIRGRYSV